MAFYAVFLEFSNSGITIRRTEGVCSPIFAVTNKKSMTKKILLNALLRFSKHIK